MAFFIALIIILCKSWSLSQPYLTFGDEVIYYKIEASILELLISSRETLGHPPLYPIIVKSLQYLTGEDAIIALRIVSLTFYSLLGLMFYRVSKAIFSSFEACLLSISILTTPLLWGRSHLIIPNIIVSALLFASLHFYIERKQKLGDIPVYLSILTRESSLTFAALFLIWKKNRKASFIILGALFSYYLLRNLIGFETIFYGPAQLEAKYTGLSSFLVLDERWFSTLKSIFSDLLYTEKTIFHYLLVIFLLDRLNFYIFRKLKFEKRVTIHFFLVIALILLSCFIIFRWEWVSYFALILNTYIQYESFPSGNYAYWQGILYSIFLFLILNLKRKSTILFTMNQKKIILSGLLISSAYIGFFSFYRDYYDRDIMIFYPLYYLTLFTIVRVLSSSRFLIIVSLSISIFINISIFTKSNLGLYRTEKSINQISRDTYKVQALGQKQEFTCVDNEVYKTLPLPHIEVIQEKSKCEFLITFDHSLGQIKDVYDLETSSKNIYLVRL